MQLAARFSNDLSSSEIIGQVWLAIKSFNGFLSHNKNQTGIKDFEKVTNVVMMGMGEPLLNFDNVVSSMNLMMDDQAYGLSKRR